MVTKSLQEKVLKTIKKYSMLEPGDRVLVALSGGPDSVALLHLLKDLRSHLGISLVAAHLNHGLRSEESDEDANFSKKLAKSLGIPIIVKKADVQHFKSRHRLSLEMAARELRYHFLNETARTHGADTIATGHTANDQAEEVLLNLVRGAGPTGLAGIPPVRDNLYIRPLIRCYRDELIAYLNERNIPFRLDSSNENLAFLRNRIRHEIIPLLEKINPQIIRTLSKTAEIIREEEVFLDNYAERILEEISSFDSKAKAFSIRIAEMFRHHVAVQRRLVRLCIKKLVKRVWGVGFDRIEEILEMCSATEWHAAIELHGNLVAEKSGKFLVIRIKHDENEIRFDITLPSTGTYRIERPHSATVSLDYLPARSIDYRNLGRLEAVMDASKVIFPLRITSFQPGDRFIPFGFGHTKKLQDFFVDEKIPRYMRTRIPILRDKEKIIWIVGYRLDDRVKVTPHTKRVLYVKWDE